MTTCGEAPQFTIHERICSDISIAVDSGRLTRGSIGDFDVLERTPAVQECVIIPVKVVRTCVAKKTEKNHRSVPIVSNRVIKIAIAAFKS